jgi:hypothetical protein
MNVHGQHKNPLHFDRVLALATSVIFEKESHPNNNNNNDSNENFKM